MSKFVYHNLTNSEMLVGNYSFEPNQFLTFEDTQTELDSVDPKILRRSVVGFDPSAGEGLLSITPSGLTKGGVALTAAEQAAVRGGLNLTLLNRLQAAIAGAKNNNPQALAPWAPAPTWAISTLYGSGAIVRGTGADAANLYLMAGSNAAVNVEGTSAGSGTGPSGAGSTLITDNTCRWVYVGSSGAVGSLPLYSTATISGPADLMNGFVQFIAHASFATIGLTLYRPETLGNFAQEAFMSGGLFNSRNAGRINGPNAGTVAVPSYAANLERGSFKLSTNSRKWIGFRPAGVIGKNGQYDIIVNERFLSESPVCVGTDGSAAFLINLSAFPDGDKEIEIRTYNNIRSAIAFEIATEVGATVWPSENPNRLKLTVEGDSISVGSYFAGYKSRVWLERIIGDRLGIDSVYNNAVGGTGAINDAAGTKTTYLQRLPDVTAFGSDIHFIGGFQNDAGDSGAYTSAARQAAILAYLQACRAALPGALLVLVGCQMLQGQTTAAGSANRHQVEVDAKAAFDAFADDNSLFIPLLTDVRARVSTANGPHYLVTTAPYNDNHPITQYYPFIGGYVADKIAAWVSAQ